MVREGAIRQTYANNAPQLTCECMNACNHDLVGTVIPTTLNYRMCVLVKITCSAFHSGTGSSVDLFEFLAADRGQATCRLTCNKWSTTRGSERLTDRASELHKVWFVL
jgi:hypothetical protein